jgi:uncharacterized protein YdcH (DUF465 family)
MDSAKFMPTETVEQRAPTQEQNANEPRGPSKAFNTMTEMLEKNLAKFKEPLPSGEPTEQAQSSPEPKKEPAQAIDPKQYEEVNVSSDKPETKPPDEELPESIRKSPKASEEFKKVRTAAQQARAEAEKYAAQIKTLEGEITKYKTAPKPAFDPAELESLKKERERLSDELKVVAIERHPSFRSHFETRTTAALEKAKSSIGDELTSKATKLAQLPASEYRTEQLDKMITELQDTSPTKAMFLSELIRDINSISYDREAALKKAQTDYEIVQRVEKEKADAAQAEQTKQGEQFLASAWEATKEFEAFKRGDDAKANEGVDAREKLMKSWFAGEQIPKLAPHRVPALAIEALYLRDELLPAVRAENAKLAKQIAEMTRSTPRAGETSANHVVIKQKPGSSFVEIYKKNAPQTAR